MSDRRQEITLRCRAGSDDRIELFMDGETGTWRLFIDNYDNTHCVEFSLTGLRAFHTALTQTLDRIARDPERHDAEVRHAVFLGEEA